MDHPAKLYSTTQQARINIGMKIFITGADGFIGSHLVKQLAEHELHFLQHDLRQHELVANQLKAINPQVIVHLAARTEVEQSFYEQTTFSDINYVGTVNLIESAKQCTNLENFVFASTMEVYGWQPISDLIRDRLETPEDIWAFDESTTPNPNAPYAVAKYACEKYLEYANRSYGFPYTIIRQTNSYGRKDNDFFVTERAVHQMLTNTSDIYMGYAEPYRNFIYVDDLVDAWCTVITQPDAVKNQLFCLGPPNAVKIRHWLKTIADKISWGGEIHWNTRPPRPGEIYLLNSKHDKLTAATGWEPKVDMSTGLDLTIAHWRDKIDSKS